MWLLLEGEGATALDGKLPFAAKKTLTYMITKGNYFLSICIGKN